MSAFAVAAAALSAFVWGSADYCGGRATRRASAWTVTLWSQLAGAVVLCAAVLLTAGRAYAVDFVWGGGAGVAGLIGLVLLYQGLATGNASVVAPITAVTSALVPMVVGLVSQQTPEPVSLVGAVCAVVAIGMVSMAPSAVGLQAPVGPRLIVLALTSGALFGVFFVLLARAHDDSGMWPLIGARGCSIVVGLLLVSARRLPLRLPAGTGRWVVLAGVGDVAANALYLVAARGGPLSVVAPVAALYPVATVLLALAVDRERIRRAQGVGLALAAVALVLTAV